MTTQPLVQGKTSMVEGAEGNETLTWLVVEDDYAIRDIINTMCELWDFNVVSFKDGFQARDYLEAGKIAPPLPDVALIDIRMPGPWGHEIGAMIRQHAELSNIAIILMTAYELAGSDEEEYLKKSGADRLIYKPLPPMDDLLDSVNDVLATRGKTT